MYYEDQARRFNLLSGFLFGTLVGTGLALLSAPLEEVRENAARSMRRRRRRKAVAKGWQRAKGELTRLAAQARGGRKRRFWG